MLGVLFLATGPLKNYNYATRGNTTSPHSLVTAFTEKFLTTFSTYLFFLKGVFQG